MAFTLTEAQRAAVEDRGGPLLVSAAAGAGKTRVLVERLLDRVEDGADVDQFLVITFTNAAAAELRSRVMEEVDRRLAQRPGDRHLRRQMTLVYSAHISTIHAFCGDLLRQCGHLIDLEPDFRLCDEGEAEVLLQEALESLLERRYEDPEEEFGLLLDVFSAGRDDGPLGEMAKGVYQKLQGHRDPGGWLVRQKEALRVEGVAGAEETPWGAYLLDRYRELARYWQGQLSALAQACRDGVPAYCPSLAQAADRLAVLARGESWDQMGPPEFPRLGSSAKCADPELARRAKELWDRCKEQMNKAAVPFQRGSREVLEDVASVAPAAEALLDLVGALGEEYRALKAKRGVLDFNDLEHRTLELLTGHPEVAEEWGDRFAEVMVDEYQDTNQVQNAIFDALTAGRGNLFMVGDVKQSIYRFRLADPTIFLDKYRTYPPREKSHPGQGRRVVLGENFRSGREVIDCVNFLFGNLMTRQLGELDYGPEEALRAGGDPPPRAEAATELHLIANPKDDEEGDDSMVEPRFIARRLRALLDEGFPVSDGQGGLRPATPSDMAILLRSPNRVLSRYVRALREMDLPYASEGGEDILEAPEVGVALSYLEIIDNPRQDVPLIAVLRSPLYGFTPDRLSRLRPRKGTGCFYDALRADGGQDCRDFLEELDALRLIAQDRRSYELLWEVYCRTGLLGLYAARPDGQSRRERLLALYAYARRFEGSGHKGLFGFLTHLRRRRERGEGLTVSGGEAAAGVRVLSIHRSKGLEYPIVVVGGLGKRFNHLDSQAPMLFHRELGLGPQGLDRERLIRYPTLCRWAVAAKLEEEMRGEELRLLYVALTRAREKLILTCTLRDPEREVDRLLSQAQLPPDPQALRHMSTVGHWVLSAALCRPEAGPLRQGAPLVQAPPVDAFYGQPWVMEPHQGAAYQAPPQVRGTVADLPRAEEEVHLPDYAWVYPHALASDLPSKLTATQLKGRVVDGEVEEDSGGPRARTVLFDRPSFAAQKGLTAGERGTAHHLVMQYLDFARAGDEEAIRAEIAGLVERQIITPQQGQAVDPAVLLAFFRSPLGREVLAAGEGLRREFKFSLLVPAQRYWPGLDSGETVLLQGVVDCWFDTPEGLVIVDFKSDRVTPETVAGRAEEYRPQLEAYAGALGEMLQRPVCRKVLWFFALDRAVEL